MPVQITFTREQVDRLKSAQRTLSEILPELDRAEKCGLDMSGNRALCGTLGDVLRAIDQHFVTGRKPVDGGPGVTGG